ncbi:class II glutamine amidotransferase [Cumulibacter manganitolerans]|uniref:class II glutamine amidotransferase n=1 Tax=Cumulibacter manganitolerans TaxID=1884992 RepID=UPI0018860136|nr:class II glutamine amidotransferase [Cumulibacter manganitolerans]
MCRLLGYVTGVPAPISASLGEGLFGQFTSLCTIHCDGWGMAWRRPDGIGIRTSPESALVDPAYAELAHQPLSDAGMVHLRWATDGLAVSPENTHPFTDGRLALAHNGSIAPIAELESLLTAESLAAVRGTTDSERYFRYLVQEIGAAADEPEPEAVRRTISALHHRFPTSSLNALLLSPSHLYAVHVNSAATGPIRSVRAMYDSADDIPLGHADSSGYFAMAYRVRDEAVHVISSGVSPAGWQPVPLDSVLAIDLGTREVAVHAISTVTTAAGPRA